MWSGAASRHGCIDCVWKENRMRNRLPPPPEREKMNYVRGKKHIGLVPESSPCPSHECFDQIDRSIELGFRCKMMIYGPTWDLAISMNFGSPRC
jgi:hypothetical protein